MPSHWTADRTLMRRRAMLINWGYDMKWPLNKKDKTQLTFPPFHSFPLRVYLSPSVHSIKHSLKKNALSSHPRGDLWLIVLSGVPRSEGTMRTTLLSVCMFIITAVGSQLFQLSTIFSATLIMILFPVWFSEFLKFNLNIDHYKSTYYRNTNPHSESFIQLHSGYWSVY